jgi:predicted dehydrogenase
MMQARHRRDFLRMTTAAVGGAAALQFGPVAKAAASDRVRVGIVGAGGRALGLIRSFSANQAVEVVAIADVDANRLPAGLEASAALQGRKPRGESDFRRLIDDTTIDALVVGTPDHWHAIPTILACQAGKDVYVEKPDGHNMEEGRRMVAAMRKHGRIVQMGTQARTTDRMTSIIEFLKTGALGRCLFAKAWESTKQGAIGRPPDGAPPPGVDYDAWLGPAPKRPFNPARFHGNWRWFYDYGSGDLGNDGVHRLDIARWALGVAGEALGEAPLGMPTVISAVGGKWYFDDVQEWPDTLQVTYQYPGATPKILTYEMRVWCPYGYHGEGEGAAVYGDKGYIVIGNGRWKAYGPKNAVLASGTGTNDDTAHVQNFIDCIKSRDKPNADLETIGHPSSVLCHAGNIAARLGRTIHLDPETEMFRNDDEANALRCRPEYRKPWVLPEV